MIRSNMEIYVHERIAKSNGRRKKDLDVLHLFCSPRELLYLYPQQDSLGLYHTGIFHRSARNEICILRRTTYQEKMRFVHVTLDWNADDILCT